MCYVPSPHLEQGMNRPLALGAIGIGIVMLAYMLMEAPDTGELPTPPAAASAEVYARPAAAPAAAKPVDAPSDADVEDAATLSTTMAENPPPKRGANPVNAMYEARRQEPDAVFAGTASKQLTKLRMLLSSDGAGRHADVLERSGALLTQLRDFRRMPIAYDNFDDLVAEYNSVVSEVRENGPTTPALTAHLDAMTMTEATLRSQLTITP